MERSPPSRSFPRQACQLARQQASLQLDNELGQFEELRLRAHLARCCDCRSFRDELRSITARLRDDEPQHAHTPVQLPQHKRLWQARPALITLATAAIAAVTIAGGIRQGRPIGALATTQETPLQISPAVLYLSASSLDLRAPSALQRPT
jgi:predicted anti-sigma-YlaC factor YlaD